MGTWDRKVSYSNVQYDQVNIGAVRKMTML